MNPPGGAGAGGGSPAAQAPTVATNSATGRDAVDLNALAERVYRLLLEDLRTGRLRRDGQR